MWSERWAREAVCKEGCSRRGGGGELCSNFIDRCFEFYERWCGGWLSYNATTNNQHQTATEQKSA